MQNDFEPVHLKEANAKLERELVSLKRDQTEEKHPEDVSVQTSLWERILGFFKNNPFVLPEDYSKTK
ncbi:hypothetical protein [Sulfurovum sp. TSL1]|uniref:hypothetical protein n=1 Tax=Sulfurovum sp. TSL1 TaxID=2826994 RepID=UPI001CC52810|nr:hypothetical protein [Sulfurovum sp. TSL1]GIT97457.1 hypothetical protein TSL1_02780 [Sulfurovum sp. TSL1]